MGVDLVILKVCQQTATVGADIASVTDLGSGVGQSDRLVKTLAAGKSPKGLTGQPLTRTDQVVDRLDVVNVERAEI